MKIRLLLIAGIIYGIINGCIPAGNIDKLPVNSPKGYVEFYYLKSDGLPMANYYIYSYTDAKGSFDLEGCVNGIRNLKRPYLRLARIPGEYSFVIPELNQPGSPKDFKLKISVEDGMITVVRIRHSDVDIHMGDHYNQYGSYKIYVYTEYVIPISEYDNYFE